ncbi:MAG: aminotransferase class I/II-fold pyridoxal phosphate-dependent enzyme [Clostridia bacterium]|nr:aminotransferase class I/II-fold pyridoxal phosphate-dependent enzyme [Clostridia bacterium]
MQFSSRMERFGDEVFAALNERRLALENQGKTLYNLSIGTPDFVPSEEIRRTLADAAMDPDNWKYALRDTPEMLSAVCDYYQRRFGVAITPNMICSCYGSQEGIGHIGLTLCDEGDTVLLPNPCYPVFMAGSLLAGARPWYYPLERDNSFLPDVRSIPEEIAKKAKYMIVSLPSNPTGSVGTPEVYQEIIDFARRYDIVVIHDNAYSDIIFDGEIGGSFLAFEGARDVGVEFFSLSKSFNLTGARISFLIGRRDVIEAFRKLRSQIDFGMFLPIQKAAIAALQEPRERVVEQCRRYQERRDALCDGLTEIGWKMPKNQGSMFVWAPLPAGYQDSMAFCLKLIEQAGVICTPGASFGTLGEGYVRFALVLPPEEIKKAVLKIRDSGILQNS